MVAVPLGEMRQAGSLRGVLSDEAVGVLIGAALPGAVGSGEEEIGTSGCFDRPVSVELGAIVDGDGADMSSGVVDELDGGSVGGHDGSGLEFANHDVAGLAVDECEEAVLVGAEHGVAF